MGIKRNTAEIIKKYPIIIGLILILALMGALLMHKLWAERQNKNVTISTAEMKRERTIEQFENPEDLIRYLLAAMQNEDMDLTLRACAIDERYLGMKYFDILKENGEFSYTALIPPASSYWEYSPLSSAQLVELYMDMYLEYVKVISAFSDVIVESIDVVYPEQQMQKEALLKMKEFSSQWGAEASCQIMALLKCDGEYKSIEFTVVKYHDYWKIFDIGAELLGPSNEGGIISIAKEEYEQIAGNKTVVEFITGLNKKLLDENDSEEDDGKLRKVKNPENEILPANYFIVSASYGKDEKAAIREFILCLQKRDITKAMSYSTVNNEAISIENLSEALLRNQANFSKELTYFYYGLLGLKYQMEPETFLEMGKNAADILNELAPGQIPYMNVTDIVQMRTKTGEKSDQYVAFYTFNQKRYMSGYTLKKYEEGWQIDSLSSDLAELHPGEVREISENNYNKWVEYDEENY